MQVQKKWGSIRAYTSKTKLPKKTLETPQLLTSVGKRKLFYQRYGKVMQESLNLLVPEQFHNKLERIERIYSVPRLMGDYVTSLPREVSFAKINLLWNHVIGSNLNNKEFDRQLSKLAGKNEGGANTNSPIVRQIYKKTNDIIKRFQIKTKSGSLIPTDDAVKSILWREAERRKVVRNFGAEIYPGFPKEVYFYGNRQSLPLDVAHEISHNIYRKIVGGSPTHNWKEELFTRSFYYLFALKNKLVNKNAILDRYIKGGQTKKQIITNAIKEHLNKYLNAIKQGKAPSSVYEVSFTALDKILEKNKWDFEKAMQEVKQIVFLRPDIQTKTDLDNYFSGKPLNTANAHKYTFDNYLEDSFRQDERYRNVY